MDDTSANGSEHTDHSRLASETSLALWSAFRRLGMVQHNTHQLYDDFHTSEGFEEMTRTDLADELRSVAESLNATADRLEDPDDH